MTGNNVYSNAKVVNNNTNAKVEKYELGTFINNTSTNTPTTSNTILDDREISIGEGAEKQVLVKGFKVVDREKLNALDDATLALWVRNGIISFINLHIKSLDNMQNLMDLSSQRNS